MEEDEPVKMFLLMPTHFNAPYMLDKHNEFYTVSIPVSEMKKFESQNELDEFLMDRYSEIFFGYKSQQTENEYIYYMNKKAEYNFYNPKRFDKK